MSRSSKRRPDKRKVRVTKNYSVQEMAKLFDKSESTILDWIREGLPTIDDKKPVLVFGWQLKGWHEAKWAARKIKCEPLEFYCSRCRGPRRLAPGSLRFDEVPGGAPRANGRCIDCSKHLFKSVTQKVAKVLESGELEDGTERFVDSSNTPTNRSERQDIRSDPSKEGKKADRHGDLNLPRNAFNERLKRDYFEYLTHADGRSELSIRKDEIAILRFEAFFKYRDLGQLSKDDAIAFKEYLLSSSLTMPVIKAALATIRQLHEYLSDEPPFARTLKRINIRYLNLTEKQRRQAKAAEHFKPVPALDDIRQVISGMPAKTPVEKRDRAMVALLAMTAVRIQALVSLAIKHLDLSEFAVYQPSAEVDTKFSKSQTTVIIPLDEAWLDHLADYVTTLKNLGFGPNDPLFPRLKPDKGKGGAFGSRTLSKEFLTSGQVLQKLIPEIFEKAGYNRHTPHALRHFHGLISNGSNANLASIWGTTISRQRAVTER